MRPFALLCGETPISTTTAPASKSLVPRISTSDSLFSTMLSGRSELTIEALTLNIRPLLTTLEMTSVADELAVKPVIIQSESESS